MPKDGDHLSPLPTTNLEEPKKIGLRLTYSMKILFVAKCDYSGLTEGVCRAFELLGHETLIFDLKKYRRIKKYISPDYTGWRLSWQLKSFTPDMVFVIAPLYMDQLIYQKLEEFRARRNFLSVGWIGDLFQDSPEIRRKIHFYDRLYFTDTGMGEMLRGFPSCYLPLATDPNQFGKLTLGTGNIHGCAFVASWTENREKFLSEVNRPISVWGPGWKIRRGNIPRHVVRPGAISLSRTGKIYSQAKTVLNLKNARNVINGLNQRSFDPPACRALLLHDTVGDLQRNFDPGKDILVFDSPEEFQSLHDKAMKDKFFRRTIAEQGYRRVVACHTYIHRAKTILSDLNL
jgi:spore maturation protein CgeB